MRSTPTPTSSGTSPCAGTSGPSLDPGRRQRRAGRPGDGVSMADGEVAVQAVADDFGKPEVQDRQEYIDTVTAGVDGMLTLVYVMLALAIIIALMGIANALSLSIHERTRELGLLRAVGTTRRQMRSMVRWESVVVASFGTVGGIVVGGFLGWALVKPPMRTASSAPSRSRSARWWWCWWSARSPASSPPSVPLGGRRSSTSSTRSPPASSLHPEGRVVRGTTLRPCLPIVRTSIAPTSTALRRHRLRRSVGQSTQRRRAGRTESRDGAWVGLPAVGGVPSGGVRPNVTGRDHFDRFGCSIRFWRLIGVL